MALKGTLKDFSVADIFQLIGQQQKSGSLYVKTKEKEARIVFDAGNVILGTFTKKNEDLLLGTMLLRAQIISSKQLQEAIQTQKSTLRSLGDTLISMNIITPPILTEFISLQLKEVLFRLFQWKDGLYEFIPEQIKYNKNIIKLHTAESILMDSFRMLDEWPSIETCIGNTDALFHSLSDTVSNSDHTFEETPDETDKSSEKNILQLLDGQHSVQEVIHLSRLGTFETCRIIAELLKKGKIVKTDKNKKNESKSKTIQDNSTWSQWKYPILIMTLFFSTAVPLLMFGVRSHFSNTFGTYLSPKEGTPQVRYSLKMLQRQYTKECIKNMLDLYWLDQGQYPSHLYEIGKDQEFSNWNYELTKENYNLQYRDQIP